MTLADALTALWRAGAFDAEPGPVRHAWAYVDGLQRAEALEAEVAQESPMLVGALVCLLRHALGDPSITAEPLHAGGWVVADGAAEWVGATELRAVIAAVIAEAQGVTLAGRDSNPPPR